MRKEQPKLSLLPDMSDELVTASQQVAVADGGRQRQTLQLSETPQPIPTRAASPVRYDSVKF
jgi:hypothetical protein